MILSVIVPVYNEKRTIDLILDKVRRVEIEKEIIVVDGNSIDGTRELLQAQESKPNTTVIYQAVRNGRGSAIKEGLEIAKGDIVIFQDADLELDPADYPDLIAPLVNGETDVVFGSRFLRGKPQMTFLQYWGNRIINIAMNLLYGTRLTDVETCYQVFRREVIHDIHVKTSHFAFTVELAAKIVKAGHSIQEIPISYVPRGRLEGKKIYWRDGFVSLWTLLKCRFFE